VIKGVYRHDVYEFPEVALRELVTNAMMHRNYAVYGSDIQVALYDDRLEIISPGGLPRGMTISRMMSGCSRCRNKAITEAFAYMHVAEKWGLVYQMSCKSLRGMVWRPQKMAMGSLWWGREWWCGRKI
jgi:predicted HTH transcriptional regulator